MVEEAYVSFETAKLLKEKGFDVKCRYYYIQTGEMFEVDIRFHTVLTTQELLNLQIVGEKEERCVAPTLSVAMKWLREIHNIIIEPGSVWNGKKWEYQLFVITPKNADSPYYEHNPYKSYEECVEAAIKYCLENLI